MIFISYASENRTFVNRLGAELTKRRRYIWLDRWEMTAGALFPERIESALRDCSAFILVLSKDSVASEWCRRELELALDRQRQDERFVIIPVLVEDCEIPTAIKGKVYIDFRKNFGEGIDQLLDATSSLTSERQGRSTTRGADHDWALDWRVSKGKVELEITAISHYIGKRYSVLCKIVLSGNKTAADKYRFYAEEGFDWFARLTTLCAVSEFMNLDELFLLMEDAEVAKDKRGFKDTTSPLVWKIEASARRLGDDDGFLLKYDYGFIIEAVRDMLARRMRPLTAEEQVRLGALVQRSVTKFHGAPSNRLFT